MKFEDLARESLKPPRNRPYCTPCGRSDGHLGAVEADKPHDPHNMYEEDDYDLLGYSKQTGIDYFGMRIVPNRIGFTGPDRYLPGE